MVRRIGFSATACSLAAWVAGQERETKKTSKKRMMRLKYLLWAKEAKAKAEEDKATATLQGF